MTTRRDKLRFAYVLTPKGIAAKADPARCCMIRKLAEHEALKPEILAVFEAGNCSQ